MPRSMTISLIFLVAHSAVPRLWRVCQRKCDCNNEHIYTGQLSSPAEWIRGAPPVAGSRRRLLCRLPTEHHPGAGQRWLNPSHAMPGFTPIQNNMIRFDGGNAVSAHVITSFNTHVNKAATTAPAPRRLFFGRQCLRRQMICRIGEDTGGDDDQGINEDGKHFDRPI